MTGSSFDELGQRPPGNHQLGCSVGCVPSRCHGLPIPPKAIKDDSTGQVGELDRGSLATDGRFADGVVAEPQHVGFSALEGSEEERAVLENLGPRGLGNSVGFRYQPRAFGFRSVVWPQSRGPTGRTRWCARAVLPAAPVRQNASPSARPHAKGRDAPRDTVLRRPAEPTRVNSSTVYRVRVRLRVIELVLAFIAGAGVLAIVAILAGWWNSTSAPVILNTVRVERSIESSILAQRHLSSTVSCPVNIIQKAGVVFNCVATVGRRQFQVVVTQTDSHGHVVYVVT